MPAFLHDLHYAVRQFRQSPGFFFAAALLIALSVAANNTAYAVLSFGGFLC